MPRPSSPSPEPSATSSPAQQQPQPSPPAAVSAGENIFGSPGTIPITTSTEDKPLEPQHGRVAPAPMHDQPGAAMDQHTSRGGEATSVNGRLETVERRLSRQEVMLERIFAAVVPRSLENSQSAMLPALNMDRHMSMVSAGSMASHHQRHSVASAGSADQGSASVADFGADATLASTAGDSASALFAPVAPSGRRGKPSALASTRSMAFPSGVYAGGPTPRHNVPVPRVFGGGRHHTKRPPRTPMNRGGSFVRGTTSPTSPRGVDDSASASASVTSHETPRNTPGGAVSPVPRPGALARESRLEHVASGDQLLQSLPTQDDLEPSASTRHDDIPTLALPDASTSGATPALMPQASASLRGGAPPPPGQRLRHRSVAFDDDVPPLVPTTHDSAQGSALRRGRHSGSSNAGDRTSGTSPTSAKEDPAKADDEKSGKRVEINPLATSTVVYEPPEQTPPSKVRSTENLSPKLVSNGSLATDTSGTANNNNSSLGASTVLGKSVDGVKRRRRSHIGGGTARDTSEMGTLQRCLDAHPPVDSDRPVVYVSDGGYIAVSLAMCCLAALGVVSGTGFDFNDQPPIGIILFVLFSQMYSVAWMVLRGAFVRKMVGDQDIADTHESVVRAYIRSWFAFDLFVSFPIELCFIGWLNPAFYYSLTRHFLRVFRMIILSRSSNPLLPDRPVLIFVVLSGALLFLVIALAVGYQLAEDNDQSLATAVYWATATLTSTGYGDIVTKTDSGRIFSTIAMLCSFAMVSLLQAYSTSLLTTRDVVKEEIARKKSTMHSMLQHFGIPWEVRKEVIYTFPAVLDSQREHSFKEMIENLPPHVTERLEFYIKLRVLQSMPRFAAIVTAVDRGIADRVTGDLAKVLTMRKIQPMDWFVQPQQPCTEALIVQSGVAEIVRFSDESEEVLQTLRRGMTLGSICLEEKEDTEREWLVGAQALQMTEMYSLHKTDYAEVKLRHEQYDLRPIDANGGLFVFDAEGEGVTRDVRRVDEEQWSTVLDPAADELADQSTDDPFAHLNAYRQVLASKAVARRPSLRMASSGTHESATPRAVEDSDRSMSPRADGAPLPDTPASMEPQSLSRSESAGRVDPAATDALS